nr:formate dehydrogenase subunit gamma [Orrella marina]
MNHPDVPTIPGAPGFSTDMPNLAARPVLPDLERARLLQILADLGQMPGALLPVLHAVQDGFGYIPPEAVGDIAERLQISRAEVHGVITFYSHFRSTPAGRHRVQICRAEACQSMGANRLIEHACERLSCTLGGTSRDASFTLEPAYCLGLCAESPAIMIDEQPYARVDAQRFDTIVDRLDARADHDSADDSVVDEGATGGEQGEVGSRPTVYVPRDTAALAVGADEVAQAIQVEAARRGLSIRIVRNGSRGLLWLETLVEVQTERGRVAYGPVTADDVPGLFDAGFLTAGSHPLFHGLTESIPYLARQQRLTFARVGVTDPLCVKDYEKHGGWQGLQKALALTSQQIVDEVKASGLRGRGGAAFPTGVKWQTVLSAQADQKYIVCNADEGDSGTFSDRMLMEGDPYALIEGMTIAALAVGATAGFIFVRSEYPHACATLREAVDRAVQAGWLGDNIQGSGRSFHLEVRMAAGAYICGEETAMLESLEGKRGQVRAKPPLPAIQGLFGKPTVINNAISLATVPFVLANGAQAYAEFGMGKSRGTLPFQLAGNLRQGGLVELAFGVTLRELLYDFGGGSASGKPLRAVQVGGPLGAYLPESEWDVPLDYEAYKDISAMVGHGGVVAFDDTVEMARMARYAMEFCAIESCGKCTPCRIGSRRGVEVIDRIVTAPAGSAIRRQNVELLNDLCDTMVAGSLCALGGMAPYPVLSALRHFPGDFGIVSESSSITVSGD